MLKIITSLSMLLAGALAQAQTEATEPFTKVQAENGIELFITEHSNFSLEIESPEDVKVSERNGTLRLSGHGKVFISAPMLESLTARDSKIRITNQLSGDRIVVSLDNSTFSGNVYSKTADFFAQSASVINLRTLSTNFSGMFETGSKANISGKVETGKLETLTGALCLARNLQTQKISAQALDNSSIIVLASKEIKVNVDDKARVTYFGKPDKVSINPEALVVYNTKVESRLLTEN